MLWLYNYLLIAFGVYVGYVCTSPRLNIHFGFHPLTALKLALTWPKTLIYHLMGL